MFFFGQPLRGSIGAWTILREIGNEELDFVPVRLWRSNDMGGDRRD
jgi:hypothetical protein